jgi:CRISPR-associated endoribonuclease Cas6
MRILLTFELTETPQLLPLNYKYPVSSWIYKVLASADKEFTTLLHEHGYQTEQGKRFKLFTFSDFDIPKGKWKIIGDRMKIYADTLSLTIAFQLPLQMQNFVAGIFKSHQISIGDEITQVNMRVKSVEVLPQEIPDIEVFKLKGLSAIFMAKQIEGKKHPDYISPDKPEYNSLFAQNLIDKYKAHCIQAGIIAKQFNIDEIVLKSLHNNPKSVKQTIKAFKKEQTEIRAFRFDFELKAPKELIEIGLNAGFGAENAQGFGCCRLVL